MTKTDLAAKCLATRRTALELCMRAGDAGAHVGGVMSLIEILTVLFCRHFDPERDRFVLSKGHGGLALYAAMRTAGLLTEEDLSHAILGEGTMLYKHPVRDPEKRILFTGGSLGQGAAFALGTQLALRGTGTRTFVVLGDGEMDEGSVWEALSVAAHHGPEGLYFLIDANGLQLSGRVDRIQRLEPLKGRLEAFGIPCEEADGHDPEAVDAALSSLPAGPAAIVFRTRKGRGVPFAEDAVDWHQKAMTREQYEAALRALEEDA